MKFILLSMIFSFYSFGSVYKILNDPIEALSARFAITKNARNSIYSSKFIFHADDTGMASLALLRAQKRLMNNPDIRLIFDGGGKIMGTDVPAEVLLHLEEEGIQVKFFNNLNDKKTLVGNRLKGRKLRARMHDKLFIVDGEYLLTGGRNIEGTYFSVADKGTYVDRDVLVTGQPVMDAQAHFLKYWNSPITTKASFSLGTRTYCLRKYKTLHLKNCKEKMAQVGKLMLDTQEEKINGLMSKFKISKDYIQKIKDELTKEDVAVKFVSDTLNDDNLTYKSILGPTMLELVSKAKKSITIESPYLIPTPNFSKAVDAILKRGVKIKILTNSLSSIDGFAVFAGYAKHRKALMSLGTAENRIQIFEYYGEKLGSKHGKTIHSKSMSIDDEIAIIGSYNLDKLSEYHNSEVAVMAWSSEKAIELRQFIEERRKYTYQLGDDGIPCPPNTCKIDEAGNFTGGKIAHPFADKKKLKSLKRWSMGLKIPGIGPWLENVL